MAKRARKIALLGTSGFVCAMIAAFSASAGLIIVLQKLNLQEKMLDLGHVRKPMALLAIFLSVVLGAAGFLLGLEGTSSEESKIRTFGWLGFWLGTISCMIGIVLGLIYWGYQY
ncbi:MAG: hypothetical protein GX629_10935 [Phycisphaerae bacterium]|jgi:uncharacterized membrane protein|nr:hypothetical protein [Phycisphaerae bacterium]